MSTHASTHVSLHFAKAVRNCILENPVITKSLAELGLVNAKVSIIHEKGTDNRQVNLCFDLAEGDNIEGIARKFGIGVVPAVMQQLQKEGVAEKPKSEFFCVPQTPDHQKDAVVAIFSFNENMKYTTMEMAGVTQPRPN